MARGQEAVMFGQLDCKKPKFGLLTFHSRCQNLKVVALQNVYFLQALFDQGDKFSKEI